MIAHNEKVGWPQCRLVQDLSKVRQEAVHNVVRDVESFLFQNKLDLSKFKHNKQMNNATQSQQYIIDIIDKKFDKLKDSIYRLGIQPAQFKEMVES
jgi:hypothetical protein